MRLGRIVLGDQFTRPPPLDSPLIDTILDFSEDGREDIVRSCPGLKNWFTLDMLSIATPHASFSLHDLRPRSFDAYVPTVNVAASEYFVSVSFDITHLN